MIMRSVQQLWEASTRECDGKGTMGIEAGEPGVKFYLFSSSAGGGEA